jgi:hypothetical protein
MTVWAQQGEVIQVVVAPVPVDMFDFDPLLHQPRNFLGLMTSMLDYECAIRMALCKVARAIN